MKNKYDITYWSVETVCVRRTVRVETDKVLNTKEKIPNEILEDVIENDTVDIRSSDYHWDTSELESYDFDNDLQIDTVTDE